MLHALLSLSPPPVRVHSRRASQGDGTALSRSAAVLPPGRRMAVSRRAPPIAAAAWVGLVRRCFRGGGHPRLLLTEGRLRFGWGGRAPAGRRRLLPPARPHARTRGGGEKRGCRGLGRARTLEDAGGGRSGSGGLRGSGSARSAASRTPAEAPRPAAGQLRAFRLRRGGAPGRPEAAGRGPGGGTRPGEGSPPVTHRGGRSSVRVRGGRLVAAKGLVRGRRAGATPVATPRSREPRPALVQQPPGWLRWDSDSRPEPGVAAVAEASASRASAPGAAGGSLRARRAARPGPDPRHPERRQRVARPARSCWAAARADRALRRRRRSCSPARPPGSRTPALSAAGQPPLPPRWPLCWQHPRGLLVLPRWPPARQSGGLQQQPRREIPAARSAVSPPHASGPRSSLESASKRNRLRARPAPGVRTAQSASGALSE